MYFCKLYLPEQKFSSPKKNYRESVFFLELHEISVLCVDTLLRHIWLTMMYMFSVKVYLIILNSCEVRVTFFVRINGAVWIDLIINMSNHWKQTKTTQNFDMPDQLLLLQVYMPVPDFTWPRASSYWDLSKTVIWRKWNRRKKNVNNTTIQNNSTIQYNATQLSFLKILQWFWWKFIGLKILISLLYMLLWTELSRSPTCYTNTGFNLVR
jgi:hypothetical protein